MINREHDMTVRTDSSMDIHEILDHLPHRYPFVLIDRVISLELGKEIIALKNVTVNEPFFPGHFPYHPVMPGVLIVEAMAQAAAILSFKTMDKKPSNDSVYYFEIHWRSNSGWRRGCGSEHDVYFESYRKVTVIN